MTVLTADDTQLVARLRHGDAAAASELYERHGGALLRFGMAMCSSRQTAEDMVHDTFVELLKHPARFDPTRGPVIAFLFAIARHRMARLVRLTIDPPDDPLTASPVAEEEEAPEDAYETLDRLQSIERVRAAVLDLPHVHREVIALCDLEEMPYATVATILGCPIGTVRSRLSRARALLATRLDLPEEPEEDDGDDPALELSVRGSLT